jgi:hypothetical protein
MLMVVGCKGGAEVGPIPKSPMGCGGQLCWEEHLFTVGSEEAGPAGTGFLVGQSKKLFVVTTFTAVERLNPASLVVTNAGGERFDDVTIRAVDRDHDVVVLGVEGLREGLEPIPWGAMVEPKANLALVHHAMPISQAQEPQVELCHLLENKFSAIATSGTKIVYWMELSAGLDGVKATSGGPVLDEQMRIAGMHSMVMVVSDDAQGTEPRAIAVHVAQIKSVVSLAAEKVVVPAPGTSCDVDSECSWTYHCVRGNCQDLLKSGMECVHDADCHAPGICDDDHCFMKGGAGSVCLGDDQCQAGTRCVMGTCREPGVEGAICTSFAHCVPPLSCDEGICGPCLVQQASDECTAPCCEDADCKGGLYCIVGKCRPVGGDGDICSLNMDCHSELCEASKCVGGGPPAKCPKKMGEGCEASDDCQPGLKCISNRCSTPIPDGGKCELTDACDKGLVCKHTSQCAPPGAGGAECKSFLECQEPLACVSGKCAPCSVMTSTGGQGANCCDDSNCIDSLYCILGACRPMGGDGCECGLADDCHSQKCKDGTCEGGGVCWQDGV